MSSLRHLALFLTESCNLACQYCFAANMEGRAIDEASARKAIDMLLRPDNPAARPSITFWGGEPLLRFDLMRSLVDYAEKRAADLDKEIRFAVPTNVTLLTGEMIDFFAAHRVQLSLSLDGDKPAQSLRKTRGGKSSFPLIEKKLTLLHERYGSALPGVRMTVSPATAARFEHNVHFFLDQGFDHIYFAPVLEASWPATALADLERGQLRLAEHWVDELLAGHRISFHSWDKALAWKEAHRQGHDLAIGIPCGAGSGMIAVDIHGDLYPCHRFVFYDKESRVESMGNLRDGISKPAQAPYQAFATERLGTSNVSCARCESREQCFIVCPALNYALHGNIYRVDERICQFSRMERRVIDTIEERVGEHPRFRRYLEGYVMRAFAPGLLSASVSALFARLDAADTDDIADRADEILKRLRERRAAAAVEDEEPGETD